MHRPVIDWDKNENIDKPGTIEHIIFTSTQKLICIRKKLPVVADKKNLTWLRPHNIHVAVFFVHGMMIGFIVFLISVINQTSLTGMHLKKMVCGHQSYMIIGAKNILMWEDDNESLCSATLFVFYFGAEISFN